MSPYIEPANVMMMQENSHDVGEKSVLTVERKKEKGSPRADYF